MYTPQWKGSIEGYSKNYCIKNLWKFASIGYDLQDLTQESYVIFLKCQMRYQETDTPQHFMALFKTAIHNHLYDLSKPYFHELQYLTRLSEELDLENYSSVEECGTFAILLSQAPIEVKQVLNLLFKAPEELLEMIGVTDGRRGKNLVSCNRKLCALLGYDPRYTNLVDMVKVYFTNPV